MPVAASIRAALSFSQSGAESFAGGPNWAGAMEKVVSLLNGTGANQFDLGYMKERTIASASNDDIDIAGVLTDPLGATITAAKLVALLIINEAKDGVQNTTNLTIGGGLNTVPGFANALAPIGPGGILLLASPGASGLATVTAGTGDIIRVANSSGAQAKYLIAALARSA